MYRIYKKQGNEIIGSLDVNEEGLIQALTTAYPMDAQKAITEKHKVEDGVSVCIAARNSRELDYWEELF